MPASRDDGCPLKPPEAGAKVCLRVRPGRPAHFRSPSAPTTHHDSTPRLGTARSSQREPTAKYACGERWGRDSTAATSTSVAQPGRGAVKCVRLSHKVLQKGPQQLGLTERSDRGGACHALCPGLLTWKSNTQL